MSRIEATFQALSRSGRKALIPYITAGDPHPRHTVSLMHALVAGGADIIELGVPFSDPMADGPTIQLACERALVHGTSLRQVIGMVAEFRKTDTKTPIVLMGYLNPIEAMGLEVFAEQAVAAGVDGVLVVDLSVEEAPDELPALRRLGLDVIFLLAPTSSAGRIEAAARLAGGYLYYVSLKGVTGARTLDVSSVAAKLAEIRGHTRLPVAVGFGIRDGEMAAQMAKLADGVVVGSALVSQIEQNGAQPEKLPALLTAQLSGLRRAMDGAS
jgi:tryptophan synthase alpha chain